MSCVVVGTGMVTPLGLSVEATMEALYAGRSGIAPIRRFDASRYPVRFAAEVGLPGDGPELIAELVRRALDEATAGLDLGAVAPERRGVFLGVEAARPDLSELAQRAITGCPPEPAELARHLPLEPVVQVAKHVDALGPSAAFSTACTSSGQAVGEALLAIRRGEVDIAIAGGVDVLVHPLMVVGFARLGALSEWNDRPTEASRPFDRDRAGFVLGEGAGLLVLASEAVAARVGTMQGHLLGYGCTSNAWRITDSPPDGRGAAEAMREALRDAGCRPEDVAYVNAHGTGTQQNDVSEARAIRAALGSSVDRIPMSSTKSLMGHLVAACGAVEAIVTLEALRRGRAPVTANLDRPDPECSLDHIRGAPRLLGEGVGLSNAFGFGGSNASLVMRAP